MYHVGLWTNETRVINFVTRQGIFYSCMQFRIGRNVAYKNQIKNQIRRFAKAPHHQSSRAPNIMTSNKDKNEHTK